MFRELNLITMTKTIIAYCIALLISISSNAQTQVEKDSVINLICKEIAANDKEADSVRVITAFNKYLNGYLLGFPENQREEIFDAIFYRLQRNCIEFKKMLNKIIPDAGDWVSLDEKPKTRLSTASCKKFDKQHLFTYLETNNDTTRVEIRDGFWTDYFLDGTYSKLKFKWINDCEFEIEFIESNNASRKGLSKKGDKYRYLIVDNNEKYYTMVVETVGTSQFSQFKLYY